MNAKGLTANHYTPATPPPCPRPYERHTEHSTLGVLRMSENFFDRYKSQISKLPKVDTEAILKELAKEQARAPKRFTPEKKLPEFGPVKVVQFGMDWVIYRHLYNFCRNENLTIYSILKKLCQPTIEAFLNEVEKKDKDAKD